jgi:hypothetical protein
MTTFTEGRAPGEAIVSEASGFRSRDTAIVTGALKANAVLGQQVLGIASSAAKAGGNAANTGALTLDVTTPVLSNAMAGVYRVRCIAAASNSGTFRVENPDGVVIGDVAVAATFADGVKFVIADGAQDFIVGEGFDITVADGSGKFVELDPDATDGSQIAAAILWADTPGAGDHVVTIVTRDAELNAGHLVWPTGITSDEKLAALAQMKLKGLIAR